MDEFLKLIDLVDNSGSLTGKEKFDLKLFLDKASRSLESYDLGRQIDYVKQLIGDLENPEFVSSEHKFKASTYKEVLMVVLERLERCKIKIESLDDSFFPAFDDYRPIRMKSFLESLGDLKVCENGDILLTPKDLSLLNKTLDVFKDDGMGYSPEGSNKVFCAYQEDNNNIELWI